MQNKCSHLCYNSIGTACIYGRLLPSTYFLRDSLGKEVVNMTDYEIISLVITLIGLLIGVVTLLLKLFAFLDTRYKRK